MVACAHADVFLLIANQLWVCNILLWDEEKETSKICKLKEFELEGAIELYPVLYAFSEV